MFKRKRFFFSPKKMMMVECQTWMLSPVTIKVTTSAWRRILVKLRPISTLPGLNWSDKSDLVKLGYCSKCFLLEQVLEKVGHQFQMSPSRSSSRSRSRWAPAWWSGRGSHSPAPTPPWSSGPAPTTFDQPTNCYLKHVELTNTPLNRQLLLYKREQ